MLKILADENIPFAYHAFSSFGKVKLASGRSLNKEALGDIDILIVRSVTNVNKNLLDGNNIKFVGTATIGSDHIDKEYLSQNNIHFADAKGCNAYSVTEYVFASIIKYCVKNNLKLNELSLGIVGFGNIGSKVYKIANQLGMNIKVSDPPLAEQGYDFSFSSLDEVLSSDIITLHVPFTKTGKYPTFHIIDENELNIIKENSLLINSSRGPVVNNETLLKYLGNKKLDIVLDVWENEPEINKELVNKVFLGTPHIAGYSLEGKVNGTKMIYKELSKFLQSAEDKEIILPPVNDNNFTYDEKKSLEENLDFIFNKIIPLNQDYEKLLRISEMDRIESVLFFDELRKSYPERREFNNYIVKTNNEVIKKKLSSFRFNIIT
ncbi:MAG: DUF3410 domain-containing protein [Syntrophothermus sp.]